VRNQSVLGTIAAGDAVFAGLPISGPALTSVNLVAPYEDAARFLRSPSASLGQLDLHPLPGLCVGDPIDLAQLGLTADEDWRRDFDGVDKAQACERGAYVGSGPGWTPAAEPRP
jgi:hypothetical protein